MNQHRPGPPSAEEWSELLQQNQILMTGAFQPIMIHDKKRVLHFNQAFCDLFGYEPDEVADSDIFKFVAKEDHDKAYENALLNLEKLYYINGLKKNGETFPMALKGYRFPLHGKDVRIVFAKDLSVNREYEQRIQYLAYHDELTGLPNRAMFNQKLSSTMMEAQINQLYVAIVFIDLDNFKNINDTYGHNTGDQVLKEAARRFVSAVGNQGVFRMGGDEFLMLLPNVHNRQQVEEKIKKLQNLFKRPFIIESNQHYITGSIGISLYPEDGETLESLLRNADTAMYQAKNSGKNSYCFYRKSMSLETFRQVSLENHLNLAVEKEQFKLVYQPKICARTGRLTGLEALIRWEHPELGTISPNHFIPLAENSGLIKDIGKWVIRRACIQSQLWRAKNYPPLSVSVNVSASQFHDSAFIEALQGILRETKLEPGLLELELTESVSFNREDEAIQILMELKKWGIQISMDDFGTGYSSLMYLSRLPIDTIKIDKTLIGIDFNNENNVKILKTLLALGDTMGVKTVAEGVETKRQFAFLRSHQCDEMQGYLFSRPLPPGELEPLLEKARSHQPVIPELFSS